MAMFSMDVFVDIHEYIQLYEATCSETSGPIRRDRSSMLAET